MVYWTPYKPLDLNLLYPPIVNPNSSIIQLEVFIRRFPKSTYCFADIFRLI